MTSSELGTIVFSEPKASGNFKKIGISDPNGKKVLIETEECFLWGVQKSDRYDSYSMPLVLKNSDQTVKTLRETSFEKFPHPTQPRPPRRSALRNRVFGRV